MLSWIKNMSNLFELTMSNVLFDPLADYTFKGVVKTHPQAIQDVHEFVSSLEQIWINLALNYLLTYGSYAVN